MRAQTLQAAVDRLRSGWSIDVVGRRFAGRTHFLKELAASLEDEGWRVLWVPGNAFVQSSGLAAIDFAGLVEGQTRGRSAMRSAMDSVLDLAANKRFAVIVDDWDGIDEASWGVLLAAQQRAQFPIARSTVRRRTLSPSSVAVTPSRSPRSFLVDLQPMRIDELERVLAVHLEAPVDSPTLARVLAKSSGVVGLAISIVDAARAEGILQREDGVWIAKHSLWTPSLIRIVEAYLSDVTSAELQALQLLSIAGEIELGTAVQLLDWDPIEQLEDKALIRIHSIGSRRLVAVVPPLVSEFLRREAHETRRARLMGALAQVVGGGQPDDLPDDSGWQQPDGIFVRAIGEHARARRSAARAEWTNEPTSSAAIRYLRALNEDHAEPREIVSVFDETDAAAGDPASRAQLHVQRAWWIAAFDDELDAALTYLDESRLGLGRYERLIDAATVDLLSNYRAVPEKAEAMLRVDGGLPQAVKDKLNESMLATYVSWGRFDLARSVLNGMSEGFGGTYPPGFLAGIVALFDGEPQQALESAYASIEAARDALDGASLRSFTYLGALALTLGGRYAEARSLIDLALSLGKPPHIPQIVHLATLSAGGLLARRRGDDETAAVMLAQRRRIGSGMAGPLPMTEWPEAQRAVNGGEDSVAADLLWNSGGQQWAKGARIGAVLDMFGSLHLVHSEERLRELTRRVNAMRSQLFTTELEFVVAVAAGDEQAILQSVPALVDAGLGGQAYGALKTVQKLRLGDSRTDLKDDLLQLATDLELSPALSDVMDFRHSAPRLSRREIEIAELAAHGLSNQQIAQRFTISARTVENHIHRILRKTGLERREALREYMRAGHLR
jgi:DNA-binding NarL/FixJ family response regulator